MRLYFKDENNNFTEIKIQYPAAIYEEFQRRMLLALQKHKSSRKTKVVYELIQKNMVDIHILVGSFEHQFGINMSSGNKLFLVVLNATKFADYASDKIIYYYNMINKSREKLEQEKRIITDHQIYNINKIKNELEKLYEQWLDAFDYSKIIDGIYLEFIRYLSRVIFLTNAKGTKKILAYSSDILKALVKKMYKETTKAPIDDSLNRNFDIVIDYFMLNYYYGDISMTALKKIEMAYGKNASELLKKSKNLNTQEFDDLVTILFDTDVFRIQKNTFDMYLRKYLSIDGAKTIKYTLQDFVGVFCTINHKNIIFNVLPFDEEKTFRLEEYILNEKSKVILIPQKKLFVD